MLQDVIISIRIYTRPRNSLRLVLDASAFEFRFVFNVQRLLHALSVPLGEITWTGENKKKAYTRRDRYHPRFRSNFVAKLAGSSKI